MKKVLFTVVSVLMLAACASDDSDAKKKDTGSKEIKVDEDVAFQDFKLTIDKVEVYEVDDKYLMDIPVKWLNLTDSEKMFMQVSGMDVKQNDELLDETNDAWNGDDGEVRKTNASQGEWTAELTYKLDNDNDSVEVTFVPTSGEDSETMKINIE